MQFKTTVRFHLTGVRMVKITKPTSAERDMEKGENSFTIGGIANWSSYSRHHCVSSSRS